MEEYITGKSIHILSDNSSHATESVPIVSLDYYYLTNIKMVEI